MRVLWTKQALEDYKYWEKTSDKTLQAIKDLIANIKETPFKGLGKPEPLKHDLQGWWSRRINKDDRLVYRVTGKPGAQTLEIAACRYHY